MLRFADGSSRTLSSANWQLGPVPLRIPEVPTTFRSLPNLVRPFSLLARLEISASGEVLDVVPDDPKSDAAVLSWIRAEVGHERSIQLVGYWSWRGGRPGISPNSTPDVTKMAWQKSETTLRPLVEWFHVVADSQTKPSVDAKPTVCELGDGD